MEHFRAKTKNTLVAAILLVMLLLASGCETNRPARVVTTSRSNGRDGDGVYVLTLSMKNTGENPAYFVVAIIDVFKSTTKIDHIEHSVGDIYPGESRTVKISVPKLLRDEPDSLAISYTYSITDNGMMP